MIPKIIHYCWFGGNPLPELAKECIISWRKFLPDYEIWEWVESDQLAKLETSEANETLKPSETSFADKVMPFDVNMIPYTQKAYKQKKYAFVSDYARFWIMYNYGGIYFDTDVEVIKSLNEILYRLEVSGERFSALKAEPAELERENKLTTKQNTLTTKQNTLTRLHYGFMGFEQDPDGDNTPRRYAPRFCFAVNPGLGFGMTKGHPFMKQMMDHYQTLKFELPPADISWYKTVVAYTTEMLMEEKPPLTPPVEGNSLQKWLCHKKYSDIQVVGDNIHIYPSEYFAPINAITGRLHITENTRTIHRYMGSWERSSKSPCRRGLLTAKEVKEILRHNLPEWVFFAYNRWKRRKYRI